MPGEVDVKLQSYNIRKNGGLYRRYFKRPFDFVLSLVAIIILSPILLLIALLVRIKLGSPVIFKQQRPGMNELNMKYEKDIPVGTFKIIAETTGAIMNISTIAFSSKQLVALAFGCEDYVTDLGGFHDKFVGPPMVKMTNNRELKRR